MDAMPQIQNERVGDETFLEAIMKPHTPYYKAVKGLFINDSVHGMAHVTGGGIEGNLSRIMPDGLSAHIDLSKVVVPPIFKYIKANGNVAESEMLKTFNCGAGLIVVANPKSETRIINEISRFYDSCTIGEVVLGKHSVMLENALCW